MSLEKLFEPGEIAGMKLKNRLVMAPMATTLAGTNGEVTQRMIEYYRARAKGGVGLIIIEVTLADTTIGNGLRVLIRCLDIEHSSYIAMFHELVEAIHDYGAKVAVQLSAGGGPSVNPETAPGAQPVSCSPLPSEFAPHIIPRELTISEIEYLIEAQGKAASRLKRAGADAIEMHAHGSYLIAQFMSPLTNHRTDKYGGDLDGRLRFAMESIQAIKSRVGNDFPLLFRYAVDEYVEGGRGLEESQIVAKRLEQAGVHALDISAGTLHFMQSSPWFIPPSRLPKSTWVHLSDAIKKVVNIPVIVAGRLGDPYLAAKVLEDEKADFIAMARPLLCDPDLPKKVATGHPEDIRRCISCNEGCLAGGAGLSIYRRCVLNPLAGRELTYKDPPERAERKKKVLIIGAGPGGMEAARVAALRGHDVVLYEKSQQLGGGQLRLTMVAPHKEDMINIIRFYEAQFKKLDNVTLKLGIEATANHVKKEKADAVVIATGSEALIPEIAGVDKANVVTARAVLRDEAKVGSAVVIIGFGMVGCETADYLSEQGKKVTLIDIKNESEVAYDVEMTSRFCLLKSLAEKAVSIVGSRVVTEITDEEVITFDFQGNKKAYKADTVVISAGSKSVTGLVSQIAKLVNEHYIIGDAKEPRKIMDAIWEGFRCCYEL
jgi:2,4-dienoyl-CoA reductase-like NADH-dependent reductase (Old Yellow Enzyme family)/thioredoxin reductase